MLYSCRSINIEYKCSVWESVSTRGRSGKAQFCIPTC